MNITTSNTTVPIFPVQYLYEFEYGVFDAGKTNMYFNDKTDSSNPFLASFEMTNKLGEKRWINYKPFNANLGQISYPNENKILYSNVYSNVDIEYEIFEKRLKESIILKAPTTQRQFEFTLKMSEGVEHTIDTEYFGDVIFTDIKTKERLFIIPAPTMEDGVQNASKKLFYSFSTKIINSTEYLTLVVNINDEEFMNNAIYPVIIDPTTLNGTTNSTPFDTYMPWSGMKRCNLSDNGTVNAYYGDAGYKDDGTNGQVMVQIPKFWYRKTVTADGYEFAISDSPESGFVVHPAFYRDRNNDGIAEEVNFRYFSAYEGFIAAGLVSKSGVSPTTNQTIGYFRTYAQTGRGAGWGITDFNLLYAVQLLYLVEFAEFDSQTMIGKGYTAGTNSAKINTGSTAAYGNSTYGYNADGVHSMSYRGIENLYGNIEKWVDGLITGTNTIMIGNKSFNNSGSGYASYTKTYTGSSGYISDIWGDDILGFIPNAFGGSATTKIHDQGILLAGYLPIFGGYWDNVNSAGAFKISINYSDSELYPLIGARLAY